VTNQIPTPVHKVTARGAKEVERSVRRHLAGQIIGFRLEVGNNGWILRGRVASFHAKQLAQHFVMKASSLPILANDIEVSF
jgi:hypothetical protein